MSVLFLGGILSFAGAAVVLAAPRFQAGPAIPHPVEGREACLTCHPLEGEGDLVLPESHAGRTEETCLACHQEKALTETTTPPPPTTEPSPTVGGPIPTLVPISPDAYRGPDLCKECHAPIFEEWNDSIHALAFQDEIFQAAWAEHDRPGYCLKCHATGYNPNTGQPVAEGITCESCHGVYEEGHPQVMMTVDAAAERCGVCHETTYQEWLLSGHGQRGIKCASCHAVHSQGLLKATDTALCSGCHTAQADDFAHATHAEHNVTCADCHMYHAPASAVEGHLPTGHLFSVESRACVQCHTRDTIHSPLATPSPDKEALARLTEQMASLEEQVQRTEKNSTRNLAFGLAGGALGGVLLGVLLGRLSRRRQGHAP